MPACLLTLTLALLAAPQPENLVVNGDLEQGTAGWHAFWSRDNAGKAELDHASPHGGKQSIRIEHSGKNDWSLAQQKWLAVEPGQIYELSGWIRGQGEGQANWGVVLRGENEKVIDWIFGGRDVRPGGQWKPLRSRFVIPPGATAIQVRLTGHGPATVWFDDGAIVRSGTIDSLRKPLPESLEITSEVLRLTFHPRLGTFDVQDARGGRWRQRPGGAMIVTKAEKAGDRIDMELLDPASLLTVNGQLRLEGKSPEVVVELRGEGELENSVAFPLPFVSEKGSLLILPVNEGICYPADDPTLGPMYYHLYGGHGLCMPWYGMTDGRRGVMTLVETPNDAAVQLPQLASLLHLRPLWLPEKGRFGPPRRLRYVFFDDGGYVAMAKRYRRYAQQTGLFKTLAEKRKENPNVDRLIGAVNVWSWDGDPASLVRELQAAGIDRVQWSSGGKPEALRQLNALGALTSRYDIYQDLMDPAVFPKLHGTHSDWTTEGWPKDIILQADGSWAKGWGVQGKQGEWYYCAVLCDRQALDYARRRIPAELKTHPYQCRFIDTTTAAPWNECYSPDHPMTRTESRKFKMDLLEFVSRDCGLVTGSETGHDAAVPFVHYFEGMMSLGPYRSPDSGRNMQKILDEPPELVAKFQTGHYYRLPLWELVYHDCVVSQWYWGDYNNKIPKVWDRRDLWNALYGTPPMFMFNRRQWQKDHERFVKSYKTAATVARATGYSEMLSHRWLSTDHAVQESTFANGVTVTVNFGDKPAALPDGQSLAPLGLRIEGLATGPK